MQWHSENLRHLGRIKLNLQMCHRQHKQRITLMNSISMKKLIKITQKNNNKKKTKKKLKENTFKK
jgi:hypothetical protein